MRTANRRHDAGFRKLLSAFPFRMVVFMLLMSAISGQGTVAIVSAKPHAGFMEPQDERPFQAGEKMLYHVDWNPPWYLFFLPAMDAGTVEISISGVLDYQDKKAVKIVFAARSSGALVKLSGFKLDDYYEIFADPENFCAYAVTRRERQGKRKRDIEIVYMKESRRLHIKDYDVSVNPPVLRKDKYVEDVPACVQDYLSALYSLRLKRIETGTVVRSVVGEYENYKNLEASVEKREGVDTPTGRYDTWHINVQALMGGLFRGGGQFKVWITADARKIPVQFEVKASIGKVTGKLMKYTPKS